MNTVIASVRTKLAKLVKSSEGASMVEYLIVVGVIALLAITAFQTLGSSISSKITSEASAINTDVQVKVD